MSYRRVSRIALVVLTGVLLACTSDTVTPTAPELDGFGTLTAEAKPQSGTFDVTVTGAVNSGGVTKESNPTKLNDTKLFIFPGMPLDEGFFADEATIPGGFACFSGASATGEMLIKLEKKNDPTKAVAHYLFGAVGKDGTTEITYHLQMFGTITAGDWLPSANVGDSSTVALVSWEMKFNSKGGKKLACTGSGGFNSTITVTRAS